MPDWLGDNEQVKSCALLVSKAHQVGQTLQDDAKAVAAMFDGSVSPLNYKQFSSIYRKMTTEHKVVSDIKDSVRTTIVVDKDDIDKVIKKLEKLKGYDRYKHQETDFGYTCNIVNFKMSNGLIAEIQVNTPKMIYAKEKENNARKIIGDELYDKIKKELKLEGGLGHQYYEEGRMLDEYLDSEKLAEIKKKSRAYYKNFK